MDAFFWRRRFGAIIDEDAGNAYALRIPVVVLAVAFALLLQAAPGASAPAVDVARPELQTLAQFDFHPPMWGMPDATTWTHMDFCIARVLSGKSFDTNTGWYTSTDGPFLIAVVSGELDIVPNGPALFFPAGQTQPPQHIDAGTSVSLGPNDAIAYSIADAATGTNPGTEPLVALFGLAGSEDFSVDGAFTSPFDVTHLDFQVVDAMPVPTTAAATVSIRRVELLPFDSFVFVPDESQHTLPALDPYRMQGLVIATGAQDAWSPAIDTVPVFGSTALTYPARGAQTLFNLGDEPIDLYFFVVEPESVPATPTP